jgi:ribosomal protein S18 acetylase RimI-like enzyme
MKSETEIDAAELADAVTVQTYLRSRAGQGAQFGPFAILFSRGDRSPYANYAIPADAADPSPAEIAALEAAFHARGRTPRLEYAPAAAPRVEAALAAAGFTVELRPPLMTCRAAADAPGPEGFELAFIDDPERLSLAVAVAAEAFGGEEADARWLLSLTAKGGRVLAAIAEAGGALVGVGALTPPMAGVAEVVGVGVRPAFRRRGLAQALAARLAAEAIRTGCALTFLSAAGEAQAAIYARAGFVRRSPMLFISRPAIGEGAPG